MSELREPDLSYVIPGWSETRWSDLLASLIATDPAPIAQLINEVPDGVRREVAVPGETSRKVDRLDLLLTYGERQVAAIEVKVLSDLGLDQLARYTAAFPNAERRYVLHLSSLPVNTTATPGWGELSWESMLAAYSRSEHPWVAATAQAWLGQLWTLVPQVDAGTVWNDVPDDAASFELALRARVAWLAARMNSWCNLDHALGLSTGGGSWTAAMWTTCGAPGHRVIVEIQEGMSAQAWRAVPERPYRDRLTGPVVLVGLSQNGVSTSADFDWSLLRRLFVGRLVDHWGRAIDGRNWLVTPANPRDAIDRANWKTMVAAGAPKWLGKGYGMATARSHNVCAFGARVHIPPSSTLGEIEAELQDLQGLAIELSEASGS